jgi:hypothetical protein
VFAAKVHSNKRKSLTGFTLKNIASRPAGLLSRAWSQRLQPMSFRAKCGKYEVQRDLENPNAVGNAATTKATACDPVQRTAAIPIRADSRSTG